MNLGFRVQNFLRNIAENNKIVICDKRMIFLLYLDLRRFRSYRGELVRDLLRAIRNKVGSHLSCVVVPPSETLKLKLFVWQLHT